MTALALTGEFGIGEVISRDKIELVKTTICKGATDDELALFIGTCNRLRLDPFARQIFFTKRWDSTENKMIGSAQTSIDGFRVIADRTGNYMGQTEPQWCGVDEVWRTVWLSDDPPSAARIGVHRNGFKDPIYAVARYKTYVQTKKDGKPNSSWTKMPDLMLSKCAEALALRKAFPNDLSGVYASEEMGQADNEAQAPRVVSVRTAPRQANRDLILQATNEVVDGFTAADPIAHVPTMVDPELRKAAMKRIGSAASTEELKDIGEWVQTLNMSVVDTTDVREQYKRKLQFLRSMTDEVEDKDVSINVVERVPGDD